MRQGVAARAIMSCKKSCQSPREVSWWSRHALSAYTDRLPELTTVLLALASSWPLLLSNCPYK